MAEITGKNVLERIVHSGLSVGGLLTGIMLSAIVVMISNGRDGE
uniref:Uncharacterized protein n=1 Tax=virus sp. ctJLD79 TaxID=2827987 RepID=A0A8S5REW0_9VIRU|nr:MAG TPA: hypothetical protein [virus sp. ctJLD79]